MLLVLIGPYFNHSHWSVSSLTEQILSPSLSLSVPLHLLTHSSTCSHTHTWHTRLQTHSLSPHSFIHLFIHSLRHLMHLTLANSFPFSHSVSHNSLLLRHSSLPHTSLSCTSFSLYFLPSLTSSLSVFDPCRAEEPPGRRTTLVPIVHTVQSDGRAAQRAAAGYAVLCVFLLHGCKQQW